MSEQAPFYARLRSIAANAMRRSAKAKAGALCVGLYGSASTWIVNVARIIVALNNPGARAALIYADEASTDENEAATQRDVGEFRIRIEASASRIRTGSHLIIKSHVPGVALAALADFTALPVFVTVRDPRDAVASLVTRFDISFAEALHLVSQSAAAIERLLAGDIGQASVFRYENGFMTSATTVKAIARRMNMTVSGVRASQIVSELAPASVRRYIEQLVALGRFDPQQQPMSQYDPATHWHPGHIGDGAVGKWRTTLTDGQCAQICRATRGFRAALQYPGPDPIQSGAEIRFGSEDAGGGWLDKGFSALEPWGVWTEGPHARMTIALDRPVRSDARLDIGCRLGPVFFLDQSQSIARISVNGVPAREIRTADCVEPRADIVLALDGGAVVGRSALTISFDLEGIKSPLECGLSSDARRLGLGIERMVISFT